MKRATLLLAGCGALLLSASFALVLVTYLTNGAGLQLFGPATFAGGVALGLVPFLALAVLAWLFFLLGIGWCALGCVRAARTRDTAGR